MKTTIFKNKTFNTALLGAAAAIALSAQPVLAFGGMGGTSAGGIGARAGGIGSIRIGSIGGRVGGLNVPGAVTIHGITVLPNGSMIVPAVTPRVQGTGTTPQLEQLNSPPVVAPCGSDSYCAP